MQQLANTGIYSSTPNHLVAWYAPAIDLPIGPAGLVGLPGVIVEVETKTLSFHLEDISYHEIAFSVDDLRAVVMDRHGPTIICKATGQSLADAGTCTRNEDGFGWGTQERLTRARSPQEGRRTSTLDSPGSCGSSLSKTHNAICSSAGWLRPSTSLRREWSSGATVSEMILSIFQRSRIHPLSS